jgi:hypothetical protein
MYRLLSEDAERRGVPGPPPLKLRPSARQLLKPLADLGKSAIADPVRTFVVSIYTIKIAAIVLLVAVLIVGGIVTMFAGTEPPPRDPEHGYTTAVCKDGAVLPPPWNTCGEDHGYLDHWTR